MGHNPLTIQADQQIMNVMGHHSTDGLRMYKRHQEQEVIKMHLRYVKVLVPTCSKTGTYNLTIVVLLFIIEHI